MRAPHPKPSAIDIRLLPLDERVESAMALDPAARPQEADELGRVLRKFLLGIDLGDVARGLGVRVRRARERAGEKEQEARDSLVPMRHRLMSAPDGELCTKTFAARNDLEKWGDSLPAGLDAGTRRLSVASDAPVKIETIATRPIETPVAVGARAKPRRRRVYASILAAMAVVTGGALFRARGGASSPGETATPAPAALPTSKAIPSAVSSVAPPRPPSPPVSPSASPPPPGTFLARAHLALYGDPGTGVSIDGVSRGACPVRDVEVEPGVHDVRFDFEPTGESRGERIPLKPGAHVTVRADFTGTTPTLRVGP